MTLPNFKSEASSYQDLRRGGGGAKCRGMIRQKYHGADRING